MPDTLPALTLHHVLQQSALSFSDRPALAFIGGESLSYHDLHDATQKLTQYLQDQGISFGDPVAILAENCPHWGIAYLAITSMGAVAIPILTEFHPDAIAHIIRHSEAKAVFVSEKLLPKIADAVFSPEPLFINLDTFMPIKQDMSRDTLKELKNAGMREFRKLMEKALQFSNKENRRIPEEDDLACIIYTSGTTGHSKGVMLTHKNIISNSLAIRTFAEINEHDRMLSVLPLAHTFECTLGLVTPLLRGACVYYLDKPPTARVLLPALEKVQPTIMLTVPLIMEKIYKGNVLPKLTANWLLRRLYAIPVIRKIMNKAAGKKLLQTFGGKLRIMAIGGAPLASDAERFLREAHFPYVIGYGLTEASPLLSGSSPAETRLGSAGYAIKGVTLRVADINPATGEGEIQAIGPNIMKGYYKAPDATSEVFTTDGWFRTGDLGYLDRDNFIYIKGRSKNMVLGPSGENIYPEEIESIFFTSPYVLEVLVYQHAEKLTARVHLDATLLDELQSPDPAEASKKRQELLEQIKSEVNSKVSSFAKISRIIEQAEPFEKTPTQKIKRYLYIDS